MNTTIALRSLVGAVLLSAAVTGCGAEQGGPPAQVSPPKAEQPTAPEQLPSDYPYSVGCSLTPDHIDRVHRKSTGPFCLPWQRRNYTMYHVLGHM